MLDIIFLCIIFFLAGFIVGMKLTSWKWKKEMREAISGQKELVSDRSVKHEAGEPSLKEDEESRL